jgi:hypothetical protein
METLDNLREGKVHNMHFNVHFWSIKLTHTNLFGKLESSICTLNLSTTSKMFENLKKRRIKKSIQYKGIFLNLSNMQGKCNIKELTFINSNGTHTFHGLHQSSTTTKLLNIASFLHDMTRP